jgi:solute carrier family 35 protein
MGKKRKGVSSPTMQSTAEWATTTKQIGASVFFGVSSIGIITVNKAVLTTFQFPAFQVVGLGQMVAILIICWSCRMAKVVDFPPPSYQQIRRVFPLPIIYIVNLIFGLGGTKKLNLPMFTVLRRFTLILVAVGQIVLLDKYESLHVNTCLALMITGAFIAALNDLAFNFIGYVYIILNNFATAANVLYSKKMMNEEMGKYEIMFYNALVAFLPAVLIAWLTGDLDKAYNYPGWSNPVFVICYLLSCVMGFVLIYSTFLCTQLTSPLTLTVVGCIKNVAVTYAGMLFGDYIFDAYNFVGINVSVGASLIYSYYKYSEQHAEKRPPPKKENSSDNSS